MRRERPRVDAIAESGALCLGASGTTPSAAPLGGATAHAAPSAVGYRLRPHLGQHGTFADAC
jgi:lipid-binding SYLF domain-containing protein